LGARTHAREKFANRLTADLRIDVVPLLYRQVVGVHPASRD
jgi:hypothetical protein